MNDFYNGDDFPAPAAFTQPFFLPVPREVMPTESLEETFRGQCHQSGEGLESPLPIWTCPQCGFVHPAVRPSCINCKAMI